MIHLPKKYQPSKRPPPKLLLSKILTDLLQTSFTKKAQERARLCLRAAGYYFVEFEHSEDELCLFKAISLTRESLRLDQRNRKSVEDASRKYYARYPLEFSGSIKTLLMRARGAIQLSDMINISDDEVALREHAKTLINAAIERIKDRLEEESGILCKGELCIDELWFLICELQNRRVDTWSIGNAALARQFPKDRRAITWFYRQKNGRYDVTDATRIIYSMLDYPPEEIFNHAKIILGEILRFPISKPEIVKITLLVKRMRLYPKWKEVANFVTGLLSRQPGYTLVCAPPKPRRTEA